MSPSAPAIMRMTPIVPMLTPDSDACTAKVRMAPSAMRKMLTPMPMAGSLLSIGAGLDAGLPSRGVIPALRSDTRDVARTADPDGQTHSERRLGQIHQLEVAAFDDDALTREQRE